MVDKTRIDAKTLGYEETLVVQYRKRRRKTLNRLYSVKRTITDPLKEDFFTQMEIIVPHPSLECPIPACLVFVQSSSGKVWFRASIDQLVAFFGLNPQDIQGLKEAIARAELIAEQYKIAQKELAIILRE